LHIRWGRFFRRFAALFLATLAVWLLLTGAGEGAVSVMTDRLEENPDLVRAALRSELGNTEDETGTLLVRLAAGESALLAANPPSLTPEPVQTAEFLPTPEPSPTPEPTPTPEPLPEAQPAPDRDDLTETSEAPSPAPGNAIERTLVPSSAAKGYVTGAGLYLYNRTELSVDLATAAAQPVGFSLSPAEAGPQILIIHTHTTEAYTPDGEDLYIESDYSRTLEEDCNMLRVGDEMERVFTELGLNVIHDRGVYDYPQYNGAYSRSGPAVKAYLEQYPTIRVVLDVHRDALMSSDGTVYKTVTSIDGVKTAQVMVVTGTDAAGGGAYDWNQNLALATKLQRSMDFLYPTLARPMTLRRSHYNQNLSPGSLLVEVGSHGCTLQEALAGARLFARAAGSIFLGLVETPQ